MSSLLSGLISYYEMEGNGNDSLGVNNASPVNVNFSLANGKVLQGGNFVWGSSTMSTGSVVGSFPSNAQPRTQTLWIRTTSADIMVFMPYGTDIPGGPPNQDFAYLIFGGNFGVGLGAGGSATFFTGFLVNDGLWHLLAITYDGTLIKVYVDNVFRGQSSSVVLDTIPTTLKFQAYQFNGDIDEVGYWNRVLTPTELTELYNSGNGITYPFTPPITETPSFLLNII